MDKDTECQLHTWQLFNNVYEKYCQQILLNVLIKNNSYYTFVVCSFYLINEVLKIYSILVTYITYVLIVRIKFFMYENES